MRVLVAMSGGVDSAVAAARAVDAGHDVVGVHLALSRGSGTQPGSGSRGCCSVADAEDAARVADRLDIPFYVWDMAEQFAADVVADFVASYEAGRTPNPCVRCNERIKFTALLDRATALGFDALATGHYARLDQGPAGPSLWRAQDRAKDQSYVLATVGPERLRRAMFPLGQAPAKAAVREEAQRRGLPVAAKPDSHDICFIPDGDTAGWLARRLGPRPGPVVDATGRQVGRHEGTYAFTVGQRRGLGLEAPAADGRPRYVLAIDPVERSVTVGPREAGATATLTGGRPTWVGDPPAPGTAVAAQFRAHGAAVPATVEACDAGAVRVLLAEPVRGAAPGQILAVYAGDRVLGGATLV